MDLRYEGYFPKHHDYNNEDTMIRVHMQRDFQSQKTRNAKLRQRLNLVTTRYLGAQYVEIHSTRNRDSKL